MPKFKVKVRQNYCRDGVLIVEAPDREAADRMVFREHPDIEWGPVEALDDWEMLCVTEADWLDRLPERLRGDRPPEDAQS